MLAWLICGVFIIVSFAGRYTRKLLAVEYASLLLVIIVSGSYALLENSIPLNWIAISLLVGVLLPPLSIAFINVTLDVRQLYELRPFLIFVRHAKWPYIIIKYVFVSFAEELVWRGAIQGYFSYPIVGIIVTSIAFTSVHFRDNRVSLAKAIDLFLFSIVLGVLFNISNSIYVPVIVHAFRNISLAYYAWKLQAFPVANLATSSDRSLNEA